MKRKEIIKTAFLNSLGVVVYIYLVSLFMNNAERIFGRVGDLVAAITVLTLLVCSALVTGALVLGKPVMLYLDHHKKSAVKLLFTTGAFLFGFLFVFFLSILVFIK